MTELGMITSTGCIWVTNSRLLLEEEGDARVSVAVLVAKLAVSLEEYMVNRQSHKLIRTVDSITDECPRAKPN